MRSELAGFLPLIYQFLVAALASKVIKLRLFITGSEGRAKRKIIVKQNSSEEPDLRNNKAKLYP